MPRWYEQRWVVIASLVFLPPVGIYLAWFHTDWSRRLRILGIAAAVVVMHTGASPYESSVAAPGASAGAPGAKTSPCDQRSPTTRATLYDCDCSRDDDCPSSFHCTAGPGWCYGECDQVGFQSNCPSGYTCLSAGSAHNDCFSTMAGLAELRPYDACCRQAGGLVMYPDAIDRHICNIAPAGGDGDRDAFESCLDGKGLGRYKDFVSE